MDQIEPEERRSIASYLRYYHGGHIGPDARFSEILPYLPAVLHKITTNLDCYLNTLEKDGDIE
ncbi:MAG: hypothetical protein ABSF64_36895 [Bryobacteraceae bacterium]|jgi:hypothetical protein